MLGLHLRDEFQGKRLKGTAIELSNDGKTGATQISAQAFLEITYPTHDLLKAIEAIGPDKGRPLAIIGERGLGKSHLMAALFHAVNDSAATGAWLRSWAENLNDPSLSSFPLRSQMLVIGESLHRQRYKFLWDLLFERHPHGAFIKGKWEGMGDSKTEIPSDKLIIELLEHTPCMVLLDEFQTWFDGLTSTKQYPWRNWAFNFIQILSDIARDRPELLVLVISVRNGNSDAFQQVHRHNPVTIDFKAGGTADRIQQDRRRLLLHRLFDNRLQIPARDVEALISIHIAEAFRLLEVAPSEQDSKRKDFVECWPFSPYLLRLLEEQVLIAADAQETRDMIRILANLFKSRGTKSPLLTAADFRVDDAESSIGALLDSVSNPQHRKLRDKALQNITSVTEALPNHAALTPHLHEMVGALWLRSIAVGNNAGAAPAVLQLDITKATAIDDNAFQVELSHIVQNSFNIHHAAGRYVFKEEENPEGKVMACARNDKLFADRSDLEYLAKEVRYSIGGAEQVARSFRVVALPTNWLTHPWPDPESQEHPNHWEDGRLPILVLPEEPDKLDERLGRWIKEHVQRYRNAPRFLLPVAGSLSLFHDRDLVVLARAALKSQEWSAQNPEYKRLHGTYQKNLRDLLQRRFDRFAILQRWNFADPSQCVFSVEKLSKQGIHAPDAMEEAIRKDLFVVEEFEAFVQEAAEAHSSVSKLLKEIQEPRPAGIDCIPWLGEIQIKERLLRLCARGKLAIDLRGMELLQAHAGEPEEDAWHRLKGKLSDTGRKLEEIKILKPAAIPASGGVHPDMFGQETAAGPGSSSAVQEVPPQSHATPQVTGTTGAAEGSRPPTGGGIFGDSSSPHKPRIRLTNPATSPLNLLGKLETWKIGPATPVSEVHLKISAATGAQLAEMLKKLPTGLTFELNLEKEDGA